jgi:hypothetical protein
VKLGSRCGGRGKEPAIGYLRGRITADLRPVVEGGLLDEEGGEGLLVDAAGDRRIEAAGGAAPRARRPRAAGGAPLVRSLVLEQPAQEPPALPKLLMSEDVPAATWLAQVPLLRLREVVAAGGSGRRPTQPMEAAVGSPSYEGSLLACLECSNSSPLGIFTKSRYFYP